VLHYIGSNFVGALAYAMPQLCIRWCQYM